MILNIVLLIVATTKTQGFILSLGTQAPPGPKAFDPNCKDVIDSCWRMPEENCRAPYEEWARQNCANRCGYCIGPTTPAPPCVNKLPNCEIYEKSVCTNPDYKTWAADNCRYYCRLCSQSELNRLDSKTTTVRPEDCVDKVDCRQYGTNACSAAFKGWSEDNCPNYCGYCTGLPTPPPVCEDKIPNCKAYNKDTCTNTDYRLWVMDNCQKYCGLCGGSGQPVTLAPPLPGGPVAPVSGRDVPVINYTPPVPQPGKRAVSEKSKREFEASHHHGGTPMCWDGDASNPSCVTSQPDVGGSTVDTIIGGNFPGSEYKPHPTPEASWDHKPNTTTVTTKPPVTTADPTTTTTQAQTESTIESITTTTTAVPPTIATGSPTRVPTEEVTTTTTTEMPTTPSIQSTTTTEPATDATIEVTTTTELPTSSSMLLDTTTTTSEPVTETSSSTTTTTELPTTQTVFVETTTTNPPTKVETSATTTTTGAPPTDTKVPSPTSTLQTTPQPVSSSAAATTQAPPKTTQPPAPTTTGLVTTTAGCADKIDNCGTYGRKICTTELYKPWATARCSAFCGFCTVVTVTPFNCADKIDNCAEFDGGNLCTDESYYVWAHDNCFNYCGFPPCGTRTVYPTNNTETIPPNSGVSEITATEMVSTTPAKSGNNTCVDKADNCMSLSDDKCFGVYAAWARSHCGLRCGYCGVLPCEDRTDCAAYPSEICTSAEYENWTRSNCRKFCNWCGRPTPPPASTQEASTTVSVQDTTANGLP